jgi:hypothetical protein
MTTTEDQVTFRLRYFCRFDADVHAFVGYVPRLQVYAQSPTEDDLKDAVTATALRFVLACADKRILGDIMQESRMRELSVTETEAALSGEEWEFVSVRGYKECADRIEVTLPFSAITSESESVA